MTTIQATKDLVIDLHLADKIGRRPRLKLRSLALEQFGQSESLIIYLDEARPLAEALIQAAEQLQALEVEARSRGKLG